MEMNQIIKNKENFKKIIQKDLEINYLDRSIILNKTLKILEFKSLKTCYRF